MDKKFNLVTNIIVVILLVIIAIGIFTAPRFNYGKLVERQVMVENEVLSIQEKMHDKTLEIDSLSGMVSKVIDELSGNFTILSERIAELLLRVEFFERDLHSLKETIKGKDNIEIPKSSMELLTQFQKSYTSPLELPDELKEKSYSLTDPLTLSQFDFPKFISSIINANLIPFSNYDQVPKNLLQELKQIRELYTTNINLLMDQERLRVSSLVDEANEQGNYTEVPMDANSDQISTNLHDKRPGLRHTRSYPELGVKRIYIFPFEIYKDWNTFQEQQLNARDHFVRDIYLIVDNFNK